MVYSTFVKSAVSFATDHQCGTIDRAQPESRMALIYQHQQPTGKAFSNTAHSPVKKHGVYSVALHRYKPESLATLLEDHLASLPCVESRHLSQFNFG